MSDIIKVAINCLKGDDTITGHTGKSRKFWVFQIRDNQIVEKSLLKLERNQTIHTVLHETGDYDNPIFKVNMIITSGIGQGAVNRLGQLGIRAVITPETSVDKAMELLLEGKLPVMAVAEHSCNHDHDHDHHHGHHHHH